jgi:hypothetical protein
MDQLHTRFEALAPQTEDWQSSPRPVGRPRWRHPLAGGVATLLVGLGVWLGSVPPAHAQDIQCGSVLGPGGRFRLERNLECPVHAVTVRDGAILDLNRHIVTCTSDSYRCVVLTGEGARLLNGVVQSTSLESIVLEGTGGHTVRNVTSTLVDANVLVWSDRNVLVNVSAMSVYSPAFIIAGHRNRLIDSTAHCPHVDDGCINVSGNGNRVIGNLATSDVGPKIMIVGHQNIVRGNRALYPVKGPRDEFAGIVVSGTGNRLESNTALDNLVDLVDTHGDCTQNIWRRNSFRTSDPACIAGSAGGAVAQMP